MGRWCGVAAIVLVAACWMGQGAAQAQTPPEGIVWLALRDLNARDFNADDPTNRPAVVVTPPEGLIRAVNVSPDGKPDWLIDYQVIGPYSFCGTGGCLQRLYVSDGDGYVRAMDRQALALDIYTVEGESRVEAWVHALNCGEADECRVAWAWDVGVRRLVQRPTREGETRLYRGGIEPLGREIGDPIREDLPQPVLLDWMVSRQVCPSGGGGMGEFYSIESEAVSLPDLNGDRVRDWMLTSAPECRQDASQDGFSLWTTGGEDGADEVYVSEAGAYLVVDIATTPATARVVEGCGYGEDCPGRALRWDAASGSLVD